MDDFDFTEDEIRDQLDLLGYRDVPVERLTEFKRDLEQLVKSERSKNSSLFSTTEQSSSDSESHRGGLIGQNGNFGTSNGRFVGTVGNSSSVEHTKYGKENILIAHPQQMKGGFYRLPLKQPEASAEEPTRRNPDVSLYRDIRIPEPYGREQDYTDETLDTTTSSDRRVIRRKVLRKRDGEKQICDESITESETDDMSSLEERLRKLPLSVHFSRPSTAPASRGQHRPASADRPQSAVDNPIYRLPENFEGVKALIRPMSVEPHKQNIKKSDPVARGQQYRQSWTSQRAPGEKQHKNLRWNVREQMLYHDEVVQKKPQKVFVTNGYTVPSDKKRKNLRWQIRNDLATGVVPPSMFD